MMRSFTHLKVFLCVVFIIVLSNVNGQIVINEFMASKTGAVVDPDYDES